MTDKFSEAFSEIEEKNAYGCESCDDFYGHGKKDRKEADLGHDVRRGDSGEKKLHDVRAGKADEKKHGTPLDAGIVKGDPAPFGS